MTSLEDRIMEVVGTCNGLICLCDDSKPGGAITLANPTNGERLVLPPLPCPDILVHGRLSWHKAYGFAQHPRTGRYMVVHVPCCFDRVWEFHTVQVFTLGETSCRDVAPPTLGGASVRCLLSAGIIGVDGAVYWIAHGTERIMSFDLEDEHVRSVQPLPVLLPTRSGSSFHLAEVYIWKVGRCDRPWLGEGGEDGRVGSREHEGGAEVEALVLRGGERAAAAAAHAAALCSWKACTDARARYSVRP
jgi:F-box interacting protein